MARPTPPPLAEDEHAQESKNAAYAAQRASSCHQTGQVRITEEGRGELAEVLLQDFFDLLFGNSADDLVGYLATLEEKQCGNAADIETRSR